MSENARKEVAPIALIEKIDFAAYIVNFLLAGVFAGLCLRRALLNAADSERTLHSFLLSGFFACVCLADLFYVVAWTVAAYPENFSAADLSWIGGYVFLIAANLHLVSGWTADEYATAKKYRFIALIAPVVVAGFATVYITLCPEIIFNYLFSDITLAISAYFSLWLLLACRGGVGRQQRSFHQAVILFLLADLFYVLFSALGWYQFAIPATLCGELYVAAVVWLFFSSRKEATTP